MKLFAICCLANFISLVIDLEYIYWLQYNIFLMQISSFFKMYIQFKCIQRNHTLNSKKSFKHNHSRRFVYNFIHFFPFTLVSRVTISYTKNLVGSRVQTWLGRVFKMLCHIYIFITWWILYIHFDLDCRILYTHRTNGRDVAAFQRHLSAH